MVAWRIDRPGLYFDEILFVNAAVGGTGNEFVYTRVWGIPVLLMEYIGALKAWLWSVVFAIWDVSPMSVRLPAIAIGLAGNVLACIAMGLLFGRTALVVAACVICFDPTVGIQSRLDWGPTAIMFFCRGGLLLSAAFACRGRPWAGLAGMAVFAAAGIFDKLNFLWIALPSFAAFCVVEHRVILDLWRRSTVLFLSATAVAGGLLAFAVARAVQSRYNDDVTPWSQRIPAAISLAWEAVAGEGATIVVSLASGHNHALAICALAGLLAAAMLGLRFLGSQQAAWWRAWIFITTVSVLVLCAFAATRSAGGQHHAAVISGLWQLPLVPPIAAGMVSLGNSRRWRTKGVLLVFLTIVTACQIAMTARSVAILLGPTPNFNWDTANWKLAEYVAQDPSNRYVVTDWGMGNHAIGLTRGKGGRVTDAWWAFRSEAGARRVIESRGARYLYCLRTEGYESMAGSRQRFLEAARSLGLAPERVASFESEHGTEMIEVVRLQPIASPG